MTKRFTITNAAVIYSGFAATALGRRVGAGGGSQDNVGGTSFVAASAAPGPTFNKAPGGQLRGDAPSWNPLHQLGQPAGVLRI